MTCDIQFYSSIEKELKHSQIHKAQEFIRRGCIAYDKASKAFICRPIERYNSTTYELRHDKAAPHGFNCNCQGYQTKVKKGEAPTCSHVLALHYFFDQRNQDNHFGRYRQADLTEEVKCDQISRPMTITTKTA